MLGAEWLSFVENYLYSFGGYRPKVASLAAPIAAGAVAVSVVLDDPSLMGKGVVQLSHGAAPEALFVTGRDASGVGSVPVWGRNHGGVPASAPGHVVGEKVTVNPLVSFAEIEATTRGVVDSLFPRLFQVKSAEFTYEADSLVYELPSDVESVIQVDYEDAYRLPDVAWVPVSRLRLDLNADVAEFPSGVSLNIWPDGGIAAGTRVRVQYRAPFGDLFAVGSVAAGIPDRFLDLVRLGVVGRIAQGFELGRVQQNSVEASGRGEAKAPFYATNVSKQLLSEFERRVAEERRRLLVQFPGRVIRSL